MRYIWLMHCSVVMVSDGLGIPAVPDGVSTVPDSVSTVDCSSECCLGNDRTTQGVRHSAAIGFNMGLVVTWQTFKL